MTYFVYVLQCENRSLYTGYTKDVERRVKLHMEGKGSKYTRMNKPLRLVYVEEANSRAEAMRRERRIKKLNHTQKLRLAGIGRDR